MKNRDINSENTKKPTVFFDFDNTISKSDVFDRLLLRFSKDKRWVELEKKWKEGEIGSRECLEGQLKSIAVTRQKLDKYLARVKLDAYFKRLLKLLESKGIKTVVLSDNFDYILNRILEYNGIKNLKVCSNKLKFSRKKLVPVFHLSGDRCLKCGHCKMSSLFTHTRKGSPMIYVGDGLSDACPSKHVNVVFAKEDLLEYCKRNKMPYIPYRTLKDVYEYFKRSYHDPEAKSRYSKN